MMNFPTMKFEPNYEFRGGWLFLFSHSPGLREGG
jgi:hypothetical protein